MANIINLFLQAYMDILSVNIMSERSGRSKVRASTRRRRARELSVSPGARSRSPLLQPLTGRDSGITSNSPSETFTKEHLLNKLKELDVNLSQEISVGSHGSEQTSDWTAEYQQVYYSILDMLDVICKIYINIS